VKLLLANHGYSDKVAQEHTSPDGSMTPTFGALYGVPETSDGQPES
jgi:hypothetical protein